MTEISGQVSAWSLDGNLERTVDRTLVQTRDGVLVGVAVTVGHLVEIHRLPPPARRCASCNLRRVLYVVRIDGTDTRAFCWTCWSGGSPE